MVESSNANSQYQKLKNLELTTSQDRSFGSILGAFIGDSLGSYLEFKLGIQKDEKVEEGMKMEGGGTWNLAPG